MNCRNFVYICLLFIIDSINKKREKGSNYLFLRANESNFPWARFLSQILINSEYHKVMASALLIAVMTGNHEAICGYVLFVIQKRRLYCFHK